MLLNRRKFLKKSAGAALSLSPLLNSCANLFKGKKNPNVLYICMEDMSPYLGCYGHDTVHSPNIDAFAAESVLLRDCHCQVALCTPSRTSILTGIRPSTSGIVKIDDDWKQILSHTVSLPRHFRDHGYCTHRVGKISDPRCGGPDDAWTESQEEWGVTGNSLPLKALENVANQDTPFFLAIGYKQAHEPWHPSPESLSKYDPEKIEPEGDGNIYKGKELSAPEIRELTRAYFASITDVDRLVGEIIQRAKELDLYENTIILVGAMDHGFSLGEHGRWGKGNNYDTETQVPLLIRVPGNPNNGKQAEGITELVDLYPTLVDLCRLPQPPQKLEGASLRELLFDPERPLKKAAFTHRAYHVNDRAVKTTQYTLIYHSDGTVELYDRIADPKNRNDISADRPDIVKEMKQLLD